MKARETLCQSEAEKLGRQAASSNAQTKLQVPVMPRI
jgi:hypothetical protein